MAAFTATDWTFTILERTKIPTGWRNRIVASLPTTGEFPSTGIPIGNPQTATNRENAWGMPRRVDAIKILDHNCPYGNVRLRLATTDTDPMNGTLRIFILTTSGTPAALSSALHPGGTVPFVMYLEAYGS